ncbi:MAG: hypothetical protein H7196_00705 [candidate division SR1 bacterium]|nr:hypothetical protein [candidate division SR1 bacterium]
MKHRGTYYYNRKYYEVFLVYNDIATLLNYPITSLLGENPYRKTRYRTDHFRRPEIINNSDLMRIG